MCFRCLITEGFELAFPLICYVLWAQPKYHRFGVFFMQALVVTLFASSFLKMLFVRPRPFWKFSSVFKEHVSTHSTAMQEYRFVCFSVLCHPVSLCVIHSGVETFMQTCNYLVLQFSLWTRYGSNCSVVYISCICWKSVGLAWRSSAGFFDFTLPPLLCSALPP